MKITVAFDISVPLNVVKSSKAWNQVNQTAQLKRAKKHELWVSSLQVQIYKLQIQKHESLD